MVLKESSLRAIDRKIDWGRHEDMPMVQGMGINEVIKRYKIPAMAWGWSGSHIGVETKKQKIFWLDEGTHLKFLGMLNKG